MCHLLPVCLVRPPCPVVSTIQTPSSIASLFNNLPTFCFRESPNRLWICWQLHVSQPTLQASSSTLILFTNSKRPHHPAKTSGPWLHQTLHPYSDALHRMSASRKDLVLEGSTADIILHTHGCYNTFLPFCWKTGEVKQWSSHCFENCLRSIPKPPSKHPAQKPSSSSSRAALVCFMTIESPMTNIKQEILHDYHAFQDVFSKQLATKLPHWP